MAGCSETSPIGGGTHWHRPGPGAKERRREPGRWRSGTEEAIAVVAEAGQDVLLGVQLPVLRCREDLDVRVRCLQRLDPLGSGLDAHLANRRRTVFLHDPYGL